MQFKIVSALAFVTLAAATILPPFPGNPLPTVGASQCNTGQLQCCNSAELPTAPDAAAILGLLGIDVGSIEGLVGITCSVIPIGSTSCSAQPVCCTNNSFGSLITIACNPVNLAL